jgi:hypothetical protein
MATLPVKAYPASDSAADLKGPVAGLADVATGEVSQSNFVYSLGFWSAVLASTLNVAYMGVMVVVALSGFVLPPPEPAQTIAGMITLRSAPCPGYLPHPHLHT